MSNKYTFENGWLCVDLEHSCSCVDLHRAKTINMRQYDGKFCVRIGNFVGISFPTKRDACNFINDVTREAKRARNELFH